MCDIWKSTDNREMRSVDLDRHREDIRRLSVRTVVLTGGEPLLNQDLRSLCKFFLDEGIHITLLTTGLLLKKRAGEVAELVDDVIVSLDGPEEIHDRIRGINGAFRLIGDGIKSVRELRPAFPFAARATVQRANRLQLRATALSARALGFNSISFLAADLTSEAFNRPSTWPLSRQNEIGLTREETIELEAEIDRLISDHADDLRCRFIQEDEAKLRRIVRHFRAHLGEIEPEAPTCNAPWVSAVVETDGLVRPCFFHRPIGNVNDDSLLNVLNGDNAQRFRRMLKMQDDPICRRCVCSLNHKDQKNS
jgi:MoaA/NifB/PqqE/SkfB family radical SAM enzyme